MPHPRQYFSDLNNLKSILIIWTGFILIGLVIAAFFNVIGSQGACTVKECMCYTIESGLNESVEIENTTGKIECNTCDDSKEFYFSLIVVNFYKECDSTQMYVCEAGEKVNEYYRQDSCEYKLRKIPN